MMGMLQLQTESALLISAPSTMQVAALPKLLVQNISSAHNTKKMHLIERKQTDESIVGDNNMRSEPFVFSGASGLSGTFVGTSGSSITSSMSSDAASVSAGAFIFSSGRTSVTGASGKDSTAS